MQQFILIGIDHGTTNSCVSIMTPQGPQILNADSGDHQATTLPSYVHMSKESGIQIGTLARNAVISKAPGTGYTGYKTRLGSDDRFAFPEVDRVLTAPEMGQLVLGRLLEPCREQFGYPPLAAVITVPAKFSTAKYDGTRKAAKLAGLEQIVLLQEPIAASLAYGFSMDSDAKWIVFDLGGGTLDVSLVSLNNGRMEIPEKGNTGDEDLGGRLFDMKLMDYVVGPKKDETQKWQFYQSLTPDYKPLRSIYSLEGFNERSNPAEWGRLALAVENAKIELSTQEEAVVVIHSTLCKDSNGKEVEVEIPINRKVYEKLIEPDVTRAVNCCLTLLRNNRLKPADIDYIIMVGGPSRTPYIQQQLSKRLRIELKKDLDPMTVVSQGAAIHAATKELEEDILDKMREDLPPADVEVQMSFPPFSQDQICDVSGQIIGDAEDYSGFTVQISRTDNDWETTLLVEDDGWFEGELMLISTGKPVQSAFKAIVKDARGNILPEEEIRIWHPYIDTDPAKLANGLKIETDGNNTRTLLKAGISLPAEDEQVFNTVKALEAGNKDDMVSINVLEGVINLRGEEDWRANCNMIVGKLIIRGDQLEGDLPANSQVDIQLHEDESREIKVVVYIPFLDQEFEATFDSQEKQPDLEQLVMQLADVKRGLDESRRLERRFPDEEVEELFEMISDERLIEDIEDGMKKIREDEASPQMKATTYKKVLCLAGTANCIFDLQQQVRLEARFDKLGKKVKDDEDKAQYENLQAAFEQVRNSGDKESLDKVEKDLESLSSFVLAREIYDLTLHLDAISYCVTDKKDKYLGGNMGDIDKILKGVEDVKVARECLDKLYTKAGWKEGETRSLDMLADLAKRNLLSKEEVDEVKVHLNRIYSFPRVDEMYTDYLNYLKGLSFSSGGVGIK